MKKMGIIFCILLSTSLMQATFITTKDELHVKLAQHQDAQQRCTCLTTSCANCAGCSLIMFAVITGIKSGLSNMYWGGGSVAVGFPYFLYLIFGGDDHIKKCVLSWCCRRHLLAPEHVKQSMQTQDRSVDKLTRIIKRKYGLQSKDFTACANPTQKTKSKTIHNTKHCARVVDWDLITQRDPILYGAPSKAVKKTVECLYDLAVLGSIRFNPHTLEERCYDARCVEPRMVFGAPANDIAQLYGSKFPIKFFLNDPTPAQRTLFEQYYNVTKEQQLDHMGTGKQD